MRNMMKEYLGNEYSENHLKNFCLYWMKGRETLPEWEDTEEWKIRFDGWRQKNDLDCLLKNQSAGEPKWLSKEEEIQEALIYMISLLESRKK